MNKKYDLGFSTDSVNESAVKITNWVYPNTVILEFGPATGRMTKYLSCQLHCSVYIVELDPDSFQLASQYAIDGICSDIEAGEWIQKFQDLQFDYIIFADVLEHLKNPEYVVIAAKKLLKPDGSILVSVPNIAHEDIILNLYCNEFCYTNTGILDETHLRFFSYNSLVRFSQNIDMSISKLDAVYEDIGMTTQSIDLSRIDMNFLEALNHRPLAQVYQFVLELKPGYTPKAVMQLEYWKNKTYPVVGNAHIYYDCGDGYSVTPIQAPLERNKSDGLYVADFVITNQVRTIRFDPIEDGCIINILSGETDQGLVQLRPSNAFETLDGWDYFLGDPQYIVTLDPTCSISYLRITWMMRVIDPAQYLNFSDIISHKLWDSESKLTYFQQEHENKVLQLHKDHSDEVYHVKQYYEDEIAKSKQHYEDEIAKSKQHYEDEIAKSKQYYEDEIAKSKQYYGDEIARVKQQNISEVTQLQVSYENNIRLLHQEHIATRTILQEENDRSLKKIDQNVEQILLLNTVIEKHEKTIEEMRNRWDAILHGRGWKLFSILNKIDNI